MNDNKPARLRSLEEVIKIVSESGTDFDSGHVLRLAEKEVNGLKRSITIDSSSSVYKALTLFEFEKGILLLNSLPDLYKVFALDFSKKLQKEYNCKTPSEKSLAETIALNFVRVLNTSSKIRLCIEKGIPNSLDARYLNILSKEVDRAQRHYLTSLQTLRMFKSPPLEVNIRTQTAIVGQNQMVQAITQNDKAI